LKAEGEIGGDAGELDELTEESGRRVPDASLPAAHGGGPGSWGEESAEGGLGEVVALAPAAQQHTEGGLAKAAFRWHALHSERLPATCQGEIAPGVQIGP